MTEGSLTFTAFRRKYIFQKNKRKERKKVNKIKREYFCSTSPSSGNQVDGLSLALHTAPVVFAGILGPRRFVILVDSFV